MTASMPKRGDPVPTAPLTVVQNFCAAWSKLDIDEMMGYFHADAVYHNIPVDPVVGRGDIRDMIVGFTAGWDRIDFEIRHAAAEGDVVLTERVAGRPFRLHRTHGEPPGDGDLRVGRWPHQGVARLLRPQPVHEPAHGLTRPTGRDYLKSALKAAAELGNWVMSESTAPS
jgi:limonene-1,2-epoxide hydrolase